MSDEAAAWDADLRAGLVEAYRRLAAEGLNRGSAGNVSCRAGPGMLITATGVDAARIAPASCVALALDGSPRGPGVPSSEWRMHAEIYRRFPEANAVVHTHADACVALACLRRPIPAFHYMVASFGGDDVRCAPYASFGSAALAAAAADALVERSACLLANHGMIARGATIDAAVSAAVKLETLARQYLMALQVAEPARLTAEEIADVRARYPHYGHARLPP